MSMMEHQLKDRGYEDGRSSIPQPNKSAIISKFETSELKSAIASSMRRAHLKQLKILAKVSNSKLDYHQDKADELMKKMRVVTRG